MFIYKLTNKINGKAYIGLTTNSLERRLIQHHYDARHRVDRPLYRAMRKYGEDAFEAEIIDTASNLQELKEKEKFWIEYYNTYGANGNGYNATHGGDVSPKSRVPYLQIDLFTGKIVEEFDSAIQCQEKLGPGALQGADQETYTQYTDYIIIKRRNVWGFTEKQIKDYAFSLRPKVICQLDKNGVLIRRWKNSSEILEKHPDYTKSCIFACLWGRRKTHKGYQWKYYKDWRDDQSVSLDL